jgi:hypothetical protein
MRVFEIRVLRIFELKREEVVGGWRRLYNDNFITFMLNQILFR